MNRQTRSSAKRIKMTIASLDSAPMATLTWTQIQVLQNRILTTLILSWLDFKEQRIVVPTCRWWCLCCNGPDLQKHTRSYTIEDIALYKRNRPDLMAACQHLHTLTSLTIVPQTQLLAAWETRHFHSLKIYNYIDKLLENNRNIVNLNVDLCGYFARTTVARWLQALPNLQQLRLDMIVYRSNRVPNNNWITVAKKLKHLHSITLGYSSEMVELGWPRYVFGISLRKLIRGSLGKRLTCLWMAHDVHIKRMASAEDGDPGLDRIVKCVAKHCPLLETFVCCFPGLDKNSPLTVQVSNDGLKILVQSCPRLKHLALSMCHGVSDDGLKALCKLQQLEVVLLRSTMTSAQGTLDMMQECKTLRSLLLPNSWKTPRYNRPPKEDLTNLDLASNYNMRAIDFRRISDEVLERMHGLWFACETDQCRLEIVKNERRLPFTRLDNYIDNHDWNVPREMMHRTTIEREIYHATHAPMSSMDVLRRFVNELN